MTDLVNYKTANNTPETVAAYFGYDIVKIREMLKKPAIKTYQDVENEIKAESSGATG